MITTLQSTCTTTLDTKNLSWNIISYSLPYHNSYFLTCAVIFILLLGTLRRYGITIQMFKICIYHKMRYYNSSVHLSVTFGKRESYFTVLYFKIICKCGNLLAMCKQAGQKFTGFKSPFTWCTPLFFGGGEEIPYNLLWTSTPNVKFSEMGNSWPGWTRWILRGQYGLFWSENLTGVEWVHYLFLFPLVLGKL